MKNYEQNFIFWQLLLFGIHIGHRFKNSSLYAGWLIFTFTYKTLIINLYKTILGFKNSNLGYDYCVKVGSPIWFLNLNKAYDIYTNEAALKCGEFAYSTYWIHGMISNWIFLADQINQLGHYTEDAHKGQFKKLEMTYSPWFLSRWSWPRSVLISSVATSEWPSHECLISKTPSGGICDTNISGHISNIATPGNDDSLDSIVYYNTNSSLYILEKKYGRITGWLHKVRTFKRNIAFSEWVLRYYLNINKMELNKNKLLNNINKREKKNKINDYMSHILKFSINIIEYWNFGVKFFFSLGLGEIKFQGSLDLYDQEINLNKWKIYGLLEKFKKRGYFICKILNYYLLKRLWNKSSSNIIKKKFMSKQWFKFRFLTTVYYKKEWHDDYYKTNFLLNRFWRNRIFKTFFKIRKFRKSKFAMKFFKFYNVYRYNQKRGFLDNFSISYLNISSFSNVVFSHCSSYFKKNFYNYLIPKNNKNNFNKKSELKKWLFYKKTILNNLIKYLFNNKYKNKYIKFYHLYKIYASLKNKLKNFIYLIYCYINFYFTFRYHNKKEYKFIKITKLKKITKLFKALNNLSKYPKYIEFFNNTWAPFKKIYSWFLKKNLKIGTCDILNIKASKIFSILSLNYRKKFFGYFVKYKYKRVKLFKKYFKKRKKLNKISNHRNYVLDTLDFKYDKFKNTKEVRNIVKNLHLRRRINYITEFYSYKYKINLDNRSTFKQVFNLIKKKNKLSLRIMNHNNMKFNIKNFNFYQISKRIYNKKIYNNWIIHINLIKNSDLWILDENNDTFIPSLFYKIFTKTNKIINKNVSKHNLNYYIKKEKLINISILKNYVKLKKKFFIYKIKKKMKKELIKFRIKKKVNYLVNNKLFINLKLNNLWYIIKKNFLINKGFSLKFWEIFFNKTIQNKVTYIYKEKRSIIKNLTYMFFIRYLNIYGKYLNIFNNTFTNNNTLLVRKNKQKLYINNIKKIYWN